MSILTNQKIILSTVNASKKYRNVALPRHPRVREDDVLGKVRCSLNFRCVYRNLIASS